MLLLFDPTLPFSSLLALLMNSALISLAVMVSDFYFSKRLDVKEILVMSISCYVIVPMFLSILSFLAPSVPAELAYFLPLVAWVILGEFRMKEVGTIKTRLGIGVISYVIFILTSFMKFQLLFSMFLLA